MPSPESPIVVLDSGLGGLTVVRSLRRTLPHERILYFGDTARVPYGSKTGPTVTQFVRQIIGYFRSYEPKHVVIACNTATALALPTLRNEFPNLSISGVIEPGARAAVEACGAAYAPIIAIIGTEATIRSKAYERAIHRRRTRAQILLRPTPLLVPIIEEGRRPEDPLVQLALHQYFAPLMDRGVNVLVLGCTHYPILGPWISKMMGPDTRVIDSADQCAEDVARRLQSAGMLHPATKPNKSAAGSAGSLKCFVTDDSPRFAALAERFVGIRVEAPTWVSTDELYAFDLDTRHQMRPAG